MKLPELLQLIARIDPQNRGVDAAAIAHAAGISARDASGYLRRGYQAGLLLREPIRDPLRRGRPRYMYKLSSQGIQALHRILKRSNQQGFQPKSWIQLLLGLLLALLGLISRLRSIAKNPIPRIDKSLILRIHSQVIQETGGELGIRDQATLETGINLASSQPEIFHAAGVLMYWIVVHHPFINGNKRAGFLAADALLRWAGYQLDVPAQAALEFLLGLAQGKYSQDQVIRWIRINSKPI